MILLFVSQTLHNWVHVRVCTHRHRYMLHSITSCIQVARMPITHPDSKGTWGGVVCVRWRWEKMHVFLHSDG